MKRACGEQAKMLIRFSRTVEEADEVISDNYRFESFGEKIAFLIGMFDVEIVSVHDADGVGKEESDKMTYFSMLHSIINGF